MKPNKLWIVLCALSPAWGQALNYDQIALLKWHPHNAVTTFKVGSEPWDVVFDGENIWVANNSDATLTKLRASDGARLGDFPVVPDPWKLLFDGANIWVSSYKGHKVMKLRARDGANLGEFPTCYYPTALAFDGSSIWVGCPYDDHVVKLRASDGALLSKVQGYAVSALAFDGVHVWALDLSGALCRLRPSDGVRVGDCSPVARNYPSADLVFDGVHIWSGTSDGVHKVRASDGAVLRSFPLRVQGLAFDGENIWAALVSYPHGVVKLRARDGAILATYGREFSRLQLAFDGAHLWIASRELNTVTKF